MYKLTETQQEDLNLLLERESALVWQSTGTGKTLLMSAFMQALTLLYNKKQLVVIRDLQIPETPNKIKDMTTLRVISLGGQKNEIDGFLIDKEDFDILCITIHTLKNLKFLAWLYQHIDEFSSINIDEVHEYSNFLTKKSYQSLWAICVRIYRVVGYTATPVTNSLDSLAHICKLLNEQVSISELNRNIKTSIKEGIKLTTLSPTYNRMTLYRDRSSLGIPNTYINHIYPLSMTFSESEYYEKNKANKDFILKSNISSESLKAMKGIVKTNKGTKGIIYAWHKECHSQIVKALEEDRIKVYSVSGDTSKDMKVNILREFNEGNIDIIVTSISTSLDMDCSYLIMYEPSTSLIQIIGRSERGLTKKVIKIYHLYYSGTEEEDNIRNFVKLQKDLSNIFGGEILQIEGMG